MTGGATEDRRRAVLASNLRWRRNFAALAVVVPLTLAWLFARQERSLAALVDHGEQVTATMLRVQGDTASYEYRVSGERHDWSVARSAAPFEEGSTFPISVLPEEPSFSRPAWPYTRALFAAERQPGFTRGVVGGLFAFFAGSALLCQRAISRSAAGLDRVPRRPVSPLVAGRIMAFLMLLCLLGANLDPEVCTVMVKLFGPAPAGLPVMLLVSLVNVVLYLPMFWTFPALLQILQARLARGGSVGKVGVVIAVFEAGPELRRARNVALAGGAYFLLLMALWIAFTAYRGV